MSEDVGVREGRLASGPFPPADDADHPVLIGRMNEWWGGRKMQQLFPRLWLQHFAGTSWLAEDEDGRPLGFLVGFMSPDHPDEAYAHLIATRPESSWPRSRTGSLRALLRGRPSRAERGG